MTPIIVFWIAFWGFIFILVGKSVVDYHENQMKHLGAHAKRNIKINGNQVRHYDKYHISDDGVIVYASK